jgi:hypothetical protein
VRALIANNSAVPALSIGGEKNDRVDIVVIVPWP